MERILYPLSPRHQEQLREKLGFSTTYDTSMDNAVNPGDYLELLNSDGKIRKVQITQKISQPISLGNRIIEHFDVIYVEVGRKDRGERIFNTSISDCYDIGWRFTTPDSAVDSKN